MLAIYPIMAGVVIDEGSITVGLCLYTILGFHDIKHDTLTVVKLLHLR